MPKMALKSPSKNSIKNASSYFSISGICAIFGTIKILVRNHELNSTQSIRPQATALEMIHDIREAFNELLEHNEWMDDETRSVAKDKANSMNERIGYPEYITNTTRLEEDYSKVRKSQNGSTDFGPKKQLIRFRFHSGKHVSRLEVV